MMRGATTFVGAKRTPTGSAASASFSTAAAAAASTGAGAASSITRPSYTNSVLVVAPAAELLALFQENVALLAPPAPRTSIADRKHFGVGAARSTNASSAAKATAAAAAATGAAAAAGVDDRRVAAAVYTLLGTGAALANARARTAFHTPAGAPPFLAQLLANARDLLQVEDADVHKIYDAIAGIVRFGVGVTPAGELALRTQSPRALLTRMLETRALIDGETPFELTDNELLLDIAVAAVQQCCAAYVHAKTHARAQTDVVIAHLNSRVTGAIDWHAKLQEAESARRVSILPDGVVAVL